MAYEHLSDDDKVLEAIRFVAKGETIPNVLKEFLEQENMYDLIVNPKELIDVVNQGESV